MFIKSLQAKSNRGAAAAFAFLTQANVDQLQETETLHGMLAGFSYSRSLPESVTPIAQQMAGEMEDIRKWWRAVKQPIEESRQRLDAARNTYLEYMSLRMPVDYWGNRAHRRWLWAIGWGVAFVVAAVVSIVLIWHFVEGELLAQDAATFKPWVAIRAGGVGIIGLWILKILSKNLNSNIHLATDAAERKTMIETYLALEKDGKLSSKDRELILNPLFRPTADGLVREDHGPPLSLDWSRLTP